MSHPLLKARFMEHLLYWGRFTLSDTFNMKMTKKNKEWAKRVKSEKSQCCLFLHLSFLILSCGNSNEPLLFTKLAFLANISIMSFWIVAILINETYNLILSQNIYSYWYDQFSLVEIVIVHIHNCYFTCNINRLLLLHPTST